MYEQSREAAREGIVFDDYYKRQVQWSPLVGSSRLQKNEVSIAPLGRQRFIYVQWTNPLTMGLRRTPAAHQMETVFEVFFVT